jgi:hypothetical protein
MTTVGSEPSLPDEPLPRLVVTRTMDADPAQLIRLVRAGELWLGPHVRGAPAGMRRYETDLRLRVSDKPEIATFRKAAYVDLGPILPRTDGWELEVAWQASTLAPLFPVFSGTVTLAGRKATLSGLYAPPGGAVGRLADRALLHVAAAGTGRWLLATLDRAARGAPEARAERERG